MKVTLVIISIALVASSALAVPVDPHAADGVAAIYAEDLQFTVLMTSGEVLILASPNNWETDPAGLPPGIGVQDIREWFGRYYLISTEGDVWQNASGGPGTWVNMGPLPSNPVSAESESLGSLKSTFR